MIILCWIIDQSQLKQALSQGRVQDAGPVLLRVLRHVLGMTPSQGQGSQDRIGRLLKGYGGPLVAIGKNFNLFCHSVR